eukprot:TRINITY_DN4759_c0_g1_i2.p1 TRINITY_DN4759_c0_g1~~TRINITY_DN4759_c0_g1_i2.p1  ORF type:complete len:277 (+),score=73.12 TRINITY_DN4759_c0_g1_i2:48-878(+)
MPDVHIMLHMPLIVRWFYPLFSDMQGKKQTARLKKLYPEMFDKDLQKEKYEEKKKDADNIDPFKSANSMTLKTLNEAQDKYVPPLSYGSPVSSEFYSNLWKAVKNQFSNITQSGRLIWLFRAKRKKEPGFKEKFSLGQFKKEAINLYTKYSTFATEGKFSSNDLEKIVSYNIAKEMRKDIRERGLDPKFGVKFEIDNISARAYNVLAISTPEPVAQDFLQISYCIKSRQGIKIFDTTTGEVLNPDDEKKMVKEYIVLEKNLSLKGDYWIIVEKLKN